MVRYSADNAISHGLYNKQQKFTYLAWVQYDGTNVAMSMPFNLINSIWTGDACDDNVSLSLQV